MIQLQNPKSERREALEATSVAVLTAAESAAAYASTADATRRLSHQTVALLTSAGFARHLVPRAWGGTEGTFEALLAAVAALGEGCASAAWCAALWSAHGRYAAYLPPDGQHDLWAAGPDVRISASVKPSGEARRLPSGWLLSGEWENVSGVEFAHWLLLAAMEPGADGPRCRLFAVPRDGISVRDTWHSTGLRGTGSHTAVMEPAFVPDHRTFLMADLVSGVAGPGRARCHTVPAHLAGGLLFCAPAVGAARRALGEWSSWAARTQALRRPDDDGSRLHHALARSADDIDTAQLLLQDAARRADTGTRADRDVLRNRRITAAGADLLVDGVERLFRTAGAHAGTGVLERSWRDVHMAAAHQLLRRESAGVAYATSVFSELAQEQAALAEPATLQEVSAGES
ncbi:acyl-CoA dehydrogenase family protein [Streptomyces sp. NPDC058470]|uniref:acyl-CoA dehydrogenase family protein n=1 Tax=Streptomyces sp. NPDC058470 TaxID=3346515 RepID=UPI0036585ABA